MRWGGQRSEVDHHSKASRWESLAWLPVRCHIKIAGPANAMLSCAPPIHVFTHTFTCTFTFYFLFFTFLLFTFYLYMLSVAPTHPYSYKTSNTIQIQIFTNIVIRIFVIISYCLIQHLPMIYILSLDVSGIEFVHHWSAHLEANNIIPVPKIPYSQPYKEVT